MLLLNKDIYKVIFCTKYTNKYIYFNPNSICGVVDRITLRILNVSRYILLMRPSLDPAFCGMFVLISVPDPSLSF